MDNLPQGLDKESPILSKSCDLVMAMCDTSTASAFVQVGQAVVRNSGLESASRRRMRLPEGRSIYPAQEGAEDYQNSDQELLGLMTD